MFRGVSFGCVCYVIDDELFVERELVFYGVGVDFVGAYRVCVCFCFVFVCVVRFCENIDVLCVVVCWLDGKCGCCECWGVCLDILCGGSRGFEDVYVFERFEWRARDIDIFLCKSV